MSNAEYTISFEEYTVLNAHKMIVLKPTGHPIEMEKIGDPINLRVSYNGNLLDAQVEAIVKDRTVNLLIVSLT